ncbi:flagellar hook-length control protein FliK [Rheinheimera marina]|uniref:Flagellar hook-length control protein FliK n=1 Tax=Rheinheimera marina TaxID=1774958 RepID=A0ABV9JRJ4_9GAMM
MTDLMITTLMGRDSALNQAKGANVLSDTDSDSRFSDALAQQVQSDSASHAHKAKRQSLAVGKDDKAGQTSATKVRQPDTLATQAEAGKDEKATGSELITQDKAAASSEADELNAQLVANDADGSQNHAQFFGAATQPSPDKDLTSSDVQLDAGDEDAALAGGAEQDTEKSGESSSTEFELLKYLDNAILLGNKLRQDTHQAKLNNSAKAADTALATAESLQQNDKLALQAALTTAKGEAVSSDVAAKMAPSDEVSELPQIAAETIDVEAEVVDEAGQKAKSAKADPTADKSKPVTETPDTELPVVDQAESVADVAQALATAQTEGMSSAVVAQVKTTKSSADSESAGLAADKVVAQKDQVQTTNDVSDLELSLLQGLTTSASKADPVKAEPKSAAASRSHAAEQKSNADELVKLSQPLAQSESEADASSQDQQGQPQSLLHVLADGSTRPERVALQHGFQDELKAVNVQEKTVQSRELTQNLNPQAQRQADLLGQKLNLIQPEASVHLKEQMMLMVRDKVQTAEIRLDPAELGSMQIKISMQQDQMSVQFVVQNGQTRDLMEQQMPRLRDLLQQQGIELSQGSVQQDSSHGQQASEGSGQGQQGRQGGTDQGDSTDEGVSATQIQVAVSDRVVDYYA